jgi:hypothetical protein
MKKFFISIILSSLFLSCMSSPAKLPADQLIIQKIISSEKTKNQIFDSCMEWITKNFRSAKAVIQYQDKNEGKIICKGYTVIKYGMGIPADTYFTLSIEMKDNKARITFEDAYMIVNISNSKNESPIDNEFTFNECYKPVVEEMIFSLEKTINQKKEDW